MNKGNCKNKIRAARVGKVSKQKVFLGRFEVIKFDVRGEG
jgi:hypothetical protein